MLRLEDLVKLSIPGKMGPYVGETVWALPLRHGNYRLENEPLNEYLNYRDIVKAEIVDGRLTYKSLVIRGETIGQDSETRKSNS